MITSEKSYIFFDFENNFHTNSIEKVCNQNGLYFHKCLTNLMPNFSMLVNDAKLIFKSEQIKTSLTLPIDSKDLINEVVNIVNKSYFVYKKLRYYPYQKLIKQADISTVLSNSHNIILFNLFIFKKSGINKNQLYSCIWPNDKDIYLNKLDTHLTNLKNFIINNCDENIEFRTTNGLLKLN